MANMIAPTDVTTTTLIIKPYILNWLEGTRLTRFRLEQVIFDNEVAERLAHEKNETAEK